MRWRRLAAAPAATSTGGCAGCDEKALAYLGATADFFASEMLSAAVAQASQGCARHVTARHLNAALLAERSLAEALPCAWGRLAVNGRPVPFCCAKFGDYSSDSLPLRDAPMVLELPPHTLGSCRLTLWEAQ